MIPYLWQRVRFLRGGYDSLFVAAGSIPQRRVRSLICDIGLNPQMRVRFLDMSRGEDIRVRFPNADPEYY